MKSRMCRRLLAAAALVAAGCATSAMSGAAVKTDAGARRACEQFGLRNPAFSAGRGETLRVYGPWETTFAIPGFQTIGDRMWQVACVRTSADGSFEFVPGKIAWVNAETGVVKIMGDGGR